LTYISYEVKKENINVDNLMNLCLYFLIKTESCQYLFTTIFMALKAYGMVDVMLRHLDESSYIEEGELKVMSEEVLEVVISYFKEKEKKYRLERLIMGFDLGLM